LDILVVEDEAGIRHNLVTLLRMEGFSVLEAKDGLAALTVAREHVPLLILSDVMMPGLDGYGLLKQLRADPRTAAIPFIFITARTDRTDMRRGMNLGADDFLGKPFSRDEVLDAVNARLRRKHMLDQIDASMVKTRSGSPAVDDTLAMGDLQVNTPVLVKGYRLIRQIGGGGMSEVFLAERESDGIQVALKILDTRTQKASSLLHRFIQEYALLEQIDHPNVAKIFGHGFLDESAFITMEYFPAGNIKKRIERGLSPRDALGITVQVARALAQIHAFGIIHRDLKPDNLMMRADGTIALIDFGVAKDVAQALEQTQHGEIVGSPFYLSPEQAAGRVVSPASDIYCLGVIFFEMLTGSRPYVADKVETLLYQHLFAPTPRFGPKFSDFQELLDRMMHKEPSQRFADAQAVVDYIATRWPGAVVH
jgi:serine/threonine protein kinase